MAYSYTWPATLPQSVLIDGYSETPGIQVETYPMDGGPAKTQFAGIDADVLPCTVLLDDAQLATLRTFVFDTLLGVARFGMPHPRTREVVEVRFMPSDRKIYTVTPVGGGRWRVNFTLWVLP